MRCIAVAAVTLDGKIALGHESGSSWTSVEDKEFLHKFLDGCDAVVVGNNTYKAAKEPLARRNCVVLTHSVEGAKRVNEKLLYVNPASANLTAELAGYKQVAVLGGAQTYSYFLLNGLLHELYLTVEPIVFGRGIGLFEHEGAEKRLELLSFERLNSQGALLLHYRVL